MGSTLIMLAAFLAGCGMPKTLPDAYRGCEADSQEPSCERVAGKLEQVVDDFDAAYLGAKQGWRAGAQGFVEVLEAELDAATCYHKWIKGQVIGDTIKGAYIPDNAAEMCGDAAETVDILPARRGIPLASIQRGSNTGVKIYCVGRKSEAACSYDNPDEKREGPAVLTRVLKEQDNASSDRLCEQASLVVSQNPIRTQEAEEGKKGNISRVIVSTDEDSVVRPNPEQSIACYTIKSGETICELAVYEAVGYAYSQVSASVTSLSCPAVAGLIDDSWVPHRKVVAQLSAKEMQQVRERVDAPEVEQEEEPAYTISDVVLGVADVSGETPYKEAPRFLTSVAPVLDGLFDLLPVENVRYHTTIDPDGSGYNTTITITAYTKEQDTNLDSTENIIIVMDTMTNGGYENQFTITPVNAQVGGWDVLPRETSYLVEYPRSKNVDQVREELGKVSVQYREVCPEVSQYNPAVAAFQESGPAAEIVECAHERINTNDAHAQPMLWGVASLHGEVWQHQSMDVQTIAAGTYATITTGTGTLSHVVCDAGAAWTQFQPKEGSPITTFAPDESLTQQYAGKELTPLNARSFCRASR